MNKKYKPKKPIVYDIDRSLLHTASRNVLNATDSDTIIGQPTFHNKQIKIGTERVQVGTERVQVGTRNITKSVTGSIKHTYFQGTGYDLTNYTNVPLLIKSTDGKYTYTIAAGRTQHITRRGNTFYIYEGSSGNPIYCNSGDSVLQYRDIDGNNTIDKFNKSGGYVVSYIEPVYEEHPVYEEQPVYKDSPVKGLIMYLRRKEA